MPLEVRDIEKSYGRFAALKSVSLFAEDGEFLALLGPSGSGKTTLLRVIAGLETADAGAVTFKDEDLLAKQVRDRGIGFVFQHYALFRHMTAAQNIAFGMQARGDTHGPVIAPTGGGLFRNRPLYGPRPKVASREAIDAKVSELLKLVQLDGLGHRFPAQLSGGQRQRVALARALAIDPKILLLDEPFGALDAKVRRELRRWLRELHERSGLTTVFVTHDQEEALELADRVALLRDGELEQVGTPEELYHEPSSAFVFDFLGDSVRLPCVVDGGIAIIAGAGVPIIGERLAIKGPATAHVRPDGFSVAIGEGPGLPARVRNVLLAGPEARIDCALDNGEALEVRIAHDDAQRLSPRDRVTLTPRAVRVWADGAETLAPPTTQV